MTKFRTPDFWYNTKSPGARALASLLAPLSLLYATGRKIHAARRRPCHAGIPVLCIGNLTAGGSGKTPAAIALLSLIRPNGLAKNPFFLSRGYGGTLSGPVRVDPHHHDFRAVGDEPLLLARHAPTIVARDRRAGAALAKAQGADLIVLDDGFQNPSLFKDISIVVIDGASGFGNGRLLPAGPLRESVATALPRLDAFVMIGPDKHHLRPLLPPEKPVFRAGFRVTAPPDPARRWLAFAGMGRPKKFRASIESLGLALAGWETFPDHYAYTYGDLAGLQARAHALGAALLTTEKDALRLPPDFAAQVTTLPVVLDIEEENAIVAFLKERLLRPHSPDRIPP